MLGELRKFLEPAATPPPYRGMTRKPSLSKLKVHPGEQAHDLRHTKKTHSLLQTRLKKRTPTIFVWGLRIPHARLSEKRFFGLKKIH